MRRFVAVFVATVAGLVVLLSFKIAPAKAPRPLALAGVTPGDSAAPPVGSAPATSAAPPSAPDSSTPPSTVSLSPKASPTPTKSSVKPTPKPTTKPTPKPSSTTKTVTGSAIAVGEGRRQFGIVQVQLTLTNGKITAATAVQFPENDSRSAEISQHSIPALTREVLAAQGSSIDAVSGATYTSGAYAQSVQAALDAAKA